MSWVNESVFYHVYPLGLCGAPPRNDFHSPHVPRLNQLFDWIDHWTGLGINALYLGPVWESTAHGYDTADYFWVDRRLGDNRLLADLTWKLHERGIRVILDAVFHHVGRDFWAFRDVLTNGPASPYCDWFYLRFGERSPYGDPFTYQNWNGAEDLVKLNLSNPAVREHLFLAVESWIRDFGIDGLRLDAADSLDHDFIRALRAFCKEKKHDFFLLGEAVFGDYTRLANQTMLDATTNYEAYKGLHSSHNDQNYFEIAYALNRQFGNGGIYRDLPLYSFADNHDVDRIASVLKDPAHLYPLHLLMFAMPGVPSVYSGSEWGIPGSRKEGGDPALRPSMRRPEGGPHPDLAAAIARLARLRRSLPALMQGDYRQLLVQSEQLAFMRRHEGQSVIAAANASASPAVIELPAEGRWVDRLNGDSFEAIGGKLRLELPSCWGRILEAV